MVWDLNLCNITTRGHLGSVPFELITSKYKTHAVLKMRWSLSEFSFLHDNTNITLPAVAYVPFWRIGKFKEIMLNGHFARFLATNSGVTYVLTNDYAISAPKEACPDTASVRVDECATARKSPTSPLIAKKPPILKRAVIVKSPQEAPVVNATAGIADSNPVFRDMTQFDVTQYDVLANTRDHIKPITYQEG